MISLFLDILLGAKNFSIISKKIKFFSRHPMVSVILPNYNHSKFLTKRIDSILNQTYQDFELIILDDCSTDNSWHLLNEYSESPKVTILLQNEVNSGNTFHQWEKGIELAKGQYIWIAESDDYCDYNFLEITSNLLDENLDTSLVYCKSHRVNEDGYFLDDLNIWYEDLSTFKWKNDYKNEGINEIRNTLSYKNTIPNASAVLFRKSMCTLNWEELLSYRLSGDWLFWIKLLEQNSVIYTTSTINYFRVHKKTVRATQENNDTSSTERKRILKYLLDKKFISNFFFSTLMKSKKQKNFLEYLKNKVNSLALHLLKNGK